MPQDPDLLRRLLRTRDRMDRWPDSPWPVARLARASGASPAHFARAFKAAFGVPPHRYLLTRRLERATQLLRDTDLPITDIALRTGWHSVGTFGRTFRDVFGEAPGTYRRGGAAQRDALAAMPVCVARAVGRPHLNTAVSEKRRREAEATPSS